MPVYECRWGKPFIPFRVPSLWRAVFYIVAALSLVPPVAGYAPAAGGDCAVAVLREADEGMSVDFVSLEFGAETLLPEDVVTVILPFGEGQSGDLIRAANREGRIYARCEEGKLRTRIEKPGAGSRELPPVSTEELHNYRIRVNVIRGDGLQRAFLLREYRSAAPDAGPVIDMFQGQIPMSDGDISVTLEVSREAEFSAPEGTVTGNYSDGLAFADAVNPDGKTGTFIVDFGAASTLVRRDFLPKGSSISEVYGIEHSDKGKRKVEGWIGGAGGEVSNFLGSAEIGSLRFGDVAFEDAGVMVVEEIPEFGGMAPAGILGLDLLSRAEAVSISYTGDKAVLQLGALEDLLDNASPDRAAWIPFTEVSNHIFIEGAVDGIPASFVLDSGARGSFVSTGVADRAGLETLPDMKREFRGLDENVFEASGVRAGRVTLAGREFLDVPFYKADMAAFRGMGITDGGALLGNDFIARQGGLTVDFLEGRIMLGH